MSETETFGPGSSRQVGATNPFEKNDDGAPPVDRRALGRRDARRRPAPVRLRSRLAAADCVRRGARHRVRAHGRVRRARLG